MDIRNRRELKAAARHSLANAACDPRKLVLIHTLAAVAFAFVITALDFFLGDRIEDTGGLGGLGLRSILSTVQSVLRLVNLVILPFWEVGYIHAAMSIARGKEVQPSSLLEGFRRWGVVLRSNLIQITLYFCVGMTCFYLSMILFMLTPLSTPLYTILAPYTNDANAALADPAVVAAVTQATIPMLILFLAVFALVALPMAYHFRMVNYALLDDPKAGAFAALRRSRLATHGDRFQLFRLDLSFWWFYLAQALLGVVCYGDLILSAVGIELPFSGTVSFFAFYVLSLALQILLYVLKRNQVAVTYAHAYDALIGAPEEPPAAPVQPRNNPWEY